MKIQDTPQKTAYFQKNQIGWTLLSNHGHVMVCLGRNPEMRLREVAFEVGITERAVQRIVSDLVAAGFLEITKVSRNNTYKLNESAKMRHPMETDITVGDLLSLLKR